MEEVLYERYGDEWEKYCTQKAKKSESRFDSAIKQFSSPLPKKSQIHFHDYHHEFLKCI